MTGPEAPQKPNLPEMLKEKRDAESRQPLHIPLEWIKIGLILIAILSGILFFSQAGGQ